MPRLLSIGEFSRTTHLSIKALRHYHDVGLLEPADVDTDSGYRLYATSQVPVAHVIRRLRDLDMPIQDVRAFLDASSPADRDAAVVAHLERMEEQLEATRAVVSSLRSLLERADSEPSVEMRSIATFTALTAREVVEWDETEAWLTEALEALDESLTSPGLTRSGPDGALYSPEFFESHVGEVVAFIPVEPPPGDAAPELGEVPGGEFAVAKHHGAFDDLDRTYGLLGTFVTERGIGAFGPIREHYVDETTTEVCWPLDEHQDTS